jgi:hypothetical protein
MLAPSSLFHLSLLVEHLLDPLYVSLVFLVPYLVKSLGEVDIRMDSQEELTSGGQISGR